MGAAPTPLRRRTIRRPAWLVPLLAGIVLGAGIALLAAADHSRDTPRGSGVPAEQARAVPAFSAIDLAPTILSLAGADVASLQQKLRTTHSLVRPLVAKAGSN